MTAFATWQDVEAGWRSLSDAERDQAQTKLDRASIIVRQQIPGVDARVTADAAYADLVKSVIAEMVTRVMRNPDGKRQESIDDYSYTRDQAVSAGELYLTDNELQLLLPRIGSLTGPYTVPLGG